MCFHHSLCADFQLCIFRIYAHLGISIQRFFMEYSKMHKNRWMETKLLNLGGGDSFYLGPVSNRPSNHKEHLSNYIASFLFAAQC